MHVSNMLLIHVPQLDGFIRAARSAVASVEGLEEALNRLALAIKESKWPPGTTRPRNIRVLVSTEIAFCGAAVTDRSCTEACAWYESPASVV